VIKDVKDKMEKERTTEEFHVHFIGVSAQMHGVCTWNSEDVKANGTAGVASSLYTWEYNSYDESTMKKLESKYGDQRPGFGCTTLAALSEEGKLNRKHDRAGNIGDFFVAVLLRDKNSHKMSTQMANSFGFCKGKEWIG
ncbi:hypothetical protein PFISCL1PPCAC_12571, partial [Pristionchus fissidentatus]